MTRGRPLVLGVLLIALPSLLRTADAAPSHAGGTGLWDVRSAHVPVRGSFSLQLSGVSYRLTDQKVEGDPADRLIIDGGLQLGYAPLDRVELWGALNLAYNRFEGQNVFSLRDGQVGGKLRLPETRRFRPAVLAHLNLPWGNRERGYSTDNVDPNVTVALTFPLPDSNTISSANLHVNVGYQWHLDDRGRAYEGWPPYYLEPVYPGGDKDRLDLRTAIEFRGEKITLWMELLLDMILNDGVSFREGPIFLTPGFRYELPADFSFVVGSKVAISSDDPDTQEYRPPNELFPEWQLTFAVTWTRDGPNVDRDGDGVPDWKDGCPKQAEDLDGFEDSDGCPELDNDGDGIPDRYDAAPNEAEDVDGFADSDGMPDPDNDGDGVPDVVDVCPNTPEDADGIADDDGCPERDADGDGIRDEDDRCPQEAENLDGVDDEDGCPDKVGFGDSYLLPGVSWEGASVEPETGSYFDLNQLAEDLRADPDLLVELRVHSPAGTGPEDLAELRAEYLKAFLVVAGVEAHRVIASGDSEMSVLTPPLGVPERIDRARLEVLPLVPRGIVTTPTD